MGGVKKLLLLICLVLMAGCIDWGEVWDELLLWIGICVFLAVASVIEVIGKKFSHRNSDSTKDKKEDPTEDKEK